MHLAELTYGTEEGRNKHRKSRSTCSFCIRFTLVALLIILLAATTTATIFILLGRGEIDDDKGIDLVPTTKGPISTPPTTTTKTTTKQPTTTTTAPPPTTTKISTTPPTTTTKTTPPTTTTSTAPPPTTTKISTTPPTTTTKTTPPTTTTTTAPPPTTTKISTTPPTTTTKTTPPTTTTTTAPTTTTETTTTPPTTTPPFAVMISINNGERFCGGSLIKRDAVLTAGPCCDKAKSFTIFLSGIDKPSRQIGKSSKYVKDSRIDLSSLDYGVCIIHLDTPIPGMDIAIIRLPSRSQRSETFEGYNATVSGWGRTSIGDNSLTYTDVIIKEKTFCQQVYPEVGAERAICTYDTNGLGICDGLVGDPLTITDSDGVETQVGYASFGPSREGGGCETYYPNGYVRVTAYLDLIAFFGFIYIRP